MNVIELNRRMVKLRDKYLYLFPECEGFYVDRTPFMVVAPLLAPLCMGEEEFLSSSFYPKESEEQFVVVDEFVDQPDYIWTWWYNGIRVKLNFRNFKDAEPDIVLYVNDIPTYEWLDIKEYRELKGIILDGVPSKVLEFIFHDPHTRRSRF